MMMNLRSYVGFDGMMTNGMMINLHLNWRAEGVHRMIMDLRRGWHSFAVESWDSMMMDFGSHVGFDDMMTNVGSKDDI